MSDVDAIAAAVSHVSAMIGRAGQVLPLSRDPSAELVYASAGSRWTLESYHLAHRCAVPTRAPSELFLAANCRFFDTARETEMTESLNAVLDAHGGLAQWNKFTCVEATIVTGGKLWGIKGQPQDPEPRRMTVTLQRQWASVRPFGAPDQRSDFTPERVAIEKLDGRVVAERHHPRESFTGHQFTTAWDPLHRAYFNGYALWTYLTTPFLMALPGFSVREVEPVEEYDGKWVGLQARFPAGVASHSTLQEVRHRQQQ